jgi:hypothetical protein
MTVGMLSSCGDADSLVAGRLPGTGSPDTGSFGGANPHVSQ